MAWADVRSRLVALLAGLSLDVYVVPPSSIPGLGVTVLLVPPARSTERRPATQKMKSYAQRIEVLHPLAADTQEKAGLAVDDAVERIDDALDGQIKWGQLAAASTPVAWQEAALVQYPPESGKQYVRMEGEMTITLRLPAANAAGA